MLLRSILCLSADSLPPTHYQRMVMHRFVSPNVDNYCDDHIRQHLKAGSPMNLDPCIWNGVTCHDGEVYFIKISKDYSSSIVVSMDWLPHTTRVVYLTNIMCENGWAAEMLPRHLRFLYIQNVILYPRAVCNKCVNLSALPSKMEELIVRSSWYRGQLSICSMPRKMRILWIDCHPNFRMTVDTTAFSSSLAFFSLQWKGFSIDVRDSKGRKIRYTYHPEQILSASRIRCQDYVHGVPDYLLD